MQFLTGYNRYQTFFCTLEEQVAANMKALVVTPKNSNEFKIVTALLKKPSVGSSTVSKDELEDIGMSKLLRQVDKTKKASRTEIMKKLSA